MWRDHLRRTRRTFPTRPRIVHRKRCANLDVQPGVGHAVNFRALARHPGERPRPLGRKRQAECTPFGKLPGKKISLQAAHGEVGGDILADLMTMHVDRDHRAARLQPTGPGVNGLMVATRRAGQGRDGRITHRRAANIEDLRPEKYPHQGESVLGGDPCGIHGYASCCYHAPDIFQRGGTNQRMVSRSSLRFSHGRRTA